MSLTIGSLFSGIGGLELGLEWAGLGPVVWQCEINPFCREVLAKHWPNVTRFEDVSRPRNWPHVDLICGGFPCQDVSAAGRGAGLAGTRSGLWWHFASVVAMVRPSVVLVENVASAMRRWLPAVRRHLCELGYNSTAYQLSAAHVGARHRRSRVFVVAYSDRFRARQQGRRRGSRRDAEAVAPIHGIEGGVAGWEPGAWTAEPAVGRVAHGVPRRLDRLRALGNAVVPQCAATIGRVIQEHCT